LVGLKAGSLVSDFVAKNPSIEVKKSWDFGRTVLVHIKAEDVDVARIRTLSEVKYVERNGYAYVSQCSSQDANGCWGLDRIDQHEELAYTSPTSPLAVYNWGVDNGEGVNVYVLDTGIDVSHSGFGGRAVWAYTAEGINSGDQDGHGHGTHCAGTIGSVPYGVAKEVNLHAVKVLEDNGAGPWSALIDGIEWVRTVGHSPGEKSVASMSLGGRGIEQSVLDAVEALYQAGVVVVIAAGNDDADACYITPAAAPNAITVGASDISDSSASFTNWGSCVDIFAPGVEVMSTLPGEGSDAWSGTSMATPHVAGVVARYMSSQASAPTPDSVAAWLTSSATADALSWTSPDHAQSPNLLLFADCPI
jgi:cerevisin